MEIRITHQGQVLHEVEITPDAQVMVRAGQAPMGMPNGMIPAPQYVWGAQGAPAAQYVWGSQRPGSAQFVWGAINDHAGGHSQAGVSIDAGAAGARSCASSGRRVTDGLLPQR